MGLVGRSGGGLNHEALCLKEYRGQSQPSQYGGLLVVWGIEQGKEVMLCIHLEMGRAEQGVWDPQR